jgi:plasmid stabilization system protein ParE
MTWIIEYLPEAERDLQLIFDHLFDSYREFGDSPGEAIGRAQQRMSGIREGAERLAATPFIGTLRPDIYPDLRFVRRNSAAIWFVANGERQTVLIVAIFFGPQDHTRRMLIRLLGQKF